ncbi:MAG TPA: protein kinase [Gemmataceae bacterium]|jgi:serine/threonine protein kinase|nr:protein kinase [Gemmataceae bacterium]
MSVPATAEDLVQLIRKSGLIDESKLNNFVQKNAGEMQGDAKQLAAAMVRHGLLTYFHAEQFLLGKWRGFTLGRYKLLERIGVGRTGQVFLCEHVYMRKRLAIKVMRPTKAEDPVTLGRFYREARVASGLEHPNIVGTYDIDQDGPLHFLVLEYVDGTCMSEIVRKFGPLNVLRACHYFRQAAQGLAYAHQRGMIHRDIEPGNIIIDRHGIAKLLDMGLARFYRDDQDLLTIKYDDKNVLGSADYVAPEQSRNSRNIDLRADIYGLGAAFYFALAGNPPFPDMTLAEKIIAHQTKKPRSMREIRPDVPQELAKLIDRMMAKDPKDRFQTAKEVVDALEMWTQVAIDPPPAAEMPLLSPAAKVEGYFGHAVPASALPTRDSSHVRPEEPARSRSTSSPMLRIPDVEADLERAATVPLPPGFKLPAASSKSPSSAKMPAATATATAPASATQKSGGSAVELILPPGKPPPPKTSAAWAQSLETNPMSNSAEATPKPAKSTAVATPAAVAAEDAPPKELIDSPVRPLAPSSVAELVLPSSSTVPELPKPPARQEPPKPGLELLRPSPAAGLPFLTPEELAGDSPRRPSFANLQVPLDPPKPPVLDRSVEPLKSRSRDMLKPPPELQKSPSRQPPKPPVEPLKPSSRDMLKPTARELANPSSRETARPPLPETVRVSREMARRTLPEMTPPERSPIYRPPNLMPFFNQPVPPSRRGPSLLSWIFRWLLMTVLSISIGVALGALVFNKFPHIAVQISEYILHPQPK